MQFYRALRKGKWKLLQNNPYQPLELYDLESDPLEKNNLVKQHPDLVKTLNQELMQYIQKGGQTPWQRPVSVLKN